MPSTRELAEEVRAYRRDHPFGTALDFALDLIAGWDEMTWWDGETRNEIVARRAHVFESLILTAQLGDPEALERLARVEALGPRVTRELRYLLCSSE